MVLFKYGQIIYYFINQDVVTDTQQTTKTLYFIHTDMPAASYSKPGFLPASPSTQAQAIRLDWSIPQSQSPSSQSLSPFIYARTAVSRDCIPFPFFPTSKYRIHIYHGQLI